MEQHNLYLPFLDIMINKDPKTNNIWMDIFCKKTDTRRCVPFNSSYQKQCKINIPFTLARRIFTIAHNSKVRKKRLGKLEKLIFPIISTKLNSRNDSSSSKYQFSVQITKTISL